MKMDKVFDAMISLVDRTKVKGDDTFNWDHGDRNRLILLIVRSDILHDTSLLKFLTKCDMMKHDTLSLLLASEILKLNQILNFIVSDDNYTHKKRFQLFINLVKDSDSYTPIDKDDKLDDENLDLV